MTQVRFHPEHASILCSGSTDGLACMFDIQHWQDEDDALLAVLNSESSVNKIGFFGPQSEYLWMTTHIETFRLWSLDTVCLDDECDLLLMLMMIRGTHLRITATYGNGSRRVVWNIWWMRTMMQRPVVCI